jgi:hypothetical protein
MHEKMIARTYLKELMGAIAIYGVLLVASIKFGRPMADGTLRTLLLLTPMLGFFGAVWAIARHLNRVDEYVRKFTLENIALAAALTAGVTFTYGFMETAGFPKLSMFVVWCVLCGAFGVASLIRAWTNR